MESRTSLPNLKPFLPKKGVYLDAQISNSSRHHRWFWERSTDSNIIKVLALPDAVINAAANRLFQKSVGFGIGYLGISATELDVIAGAIFNNPKAQIHQGGKTIPLFLLYTRATATTAVKRQENQEVQNAVSLFG